MRRRKTREADKFVWFFKLDTSTTIACTHSSMTVVMRGGAENLVMVRAMRSAESWIGVNGFLISWASRRAPRHALAFWRARLHEVFDNSTNRGRQSRGGDGRVLQPAVNIEINF